MSNGLGDLNNSQSNLMKLATLNSSFQQQQSIDQDMGTFEKKLAAEAEAFERALIEETSQPLRRALQRYEFYTRQEEQRQERKRELGSLVKRKERGFQQYTTTQQRLEKKCSTSNHHDYDAYLCLGQGGQLVEKNYYGPLLVYSSNSSASNNSSSDGQDEEESLILNKKHSDHHHHHEKSEETMDEHHSDDDLIHEAILEEQKHLIETFTAMQNGELPTPSGVASKPVYLGEDGTLYNLYYEPLPKQDSSMLRGRGKFSQIAYGSSAKSSEAEIVEGINKAKQLKDKKNLTNEEELIVKKYGQVVNGSEELIDKYVRRGRMLDRYEYQHDPDLYLSAPDPESFTSFDDYEEALLNWTKQVESKLGYLQLPRVMGRHYFRPAERSENSAAAENAIDQRASTHLHGSRHISENLTAIALKGGFDDDSLDGPNTIGHETWEAQLVPLEPKPEFYETFKEYEMAMIRWAIVTLGLPFLPPHVAQYQTLLGLKLVNEPTFQISGVQVSSQDNEEKEDLETNINDDDRLDDDKVSIRYEVKNEWENLKPNVKQEITNGIQQVVNTKMENKKKYRSYHKPVLPIIHGTLKSERKAVQLKLVAGERTKPENVRSWIVYQRQKKSLSCVPAQLTLTYSSANASDIDHQIPLRRKDLTPLDIRASQDCEEVERDVVNFDSPEYDLGEIDFNLLANNPNYMMFLQIVLARKDNEKRFDHLNSWYFPKEEPFYLSEMFSGLCSVLDKVEHPSQMKVSHFEGIFQSSVYLDDFQKFLNTDLKLRMSMMKNGVEIPVETYGKLMFCSTTKQHFSAILKFFHNSNSPLTHVKVAHYVKEFFKQENSKDIISEYLQDDDYTTLQYIARAVTLFDEVPVQLYEYSESTRNAVINIVLSDQGKKKEDSTLRMVDKFLVNLLMLYYTNCITVSLVEEDKAYPHVYPFLVTKLEKYIDEVNKYLKCSKSFLKSHIWKILGSRTKSVTALGKFVLSFLFFLSWKDDIKNALKSEDTELLNNIRKLASSTFSHVQNATARLFPLLKEYEDLLTKDYRDGNRVLRDLDLAETKSARQAVVDSRPPLVASMVLEFLNESLTVRKEEFGSQQDAYYHMIVGLIESRVFTLVLDEVLATVTQKRVHQGTVMGSLFIAKFAKFLVCNQLVPQDKTSDNNPTKWGALKTAFSLKRKEVVEVKQALYSGSKVEINSAILLSMWDFIGKPDRLRKTYRPRCAMLIAFRHLIKVPEIFNMMPRDAFTNFYTKLLELCKDDVDMEFNRNAWRLFYQLIKFHGEDVMKDIVNHNMSSFLNLITVQKSIIATNALHYFNKIFNLPIERTISNKLSSFATPDLRCEKGYNVPQKTNAQYIKTVDMLINFIINKNMVEAIFSNAYNLWSKDFKGWPFQSLATLFFTINTHSACTKLQQAFQKANIGNTLGVVCKMVSAPEDSGYHDYKRRFNLDKDVMDWNMKHKHYLYIKADEKK